MSATELAVLWTAISGTVGVILGWILKNRKTKIGFEAGWRKELREENRDLREENSDLRRYYFYAMELLINNEIEIPESMKSMQDKIRNNSN